MRIAIGYSARQDMEYFDTIHKEFGITINKYFIGVTWWSDCNPSVLDTDNKYPEPIYPIEIWPFMWRFKK